MTPAACPTFASTSFERPWAPGALASELLKDVALWEADGFFAVGGNGLPRVFCKIRLLEVVDLRRYPLSAPPRHRLHGLRPDAHFNVDGTRVFVLTKRPEMLLQPARSTSVRAVAVGGRLWNVHAKPSPASLRPVRLRFPSDHELLQSQ